ncbi:MAG: serine/threonine protein kinase [Myxococcales bacterium]|nr:serine/threonine protein kinase [Myxococcales bacterium]
MTDLPFAPVEFGRYRLLRLIGRGGMAEVYLAESHGPMTFRKLVAVKRLLPVYASNRRYVQMLLDEARIAAAINHPNVASVLDLGRVDDQHFITMEFVDGVDLADVLRACQVRGEQLPIELSLYIARCVAEGLHAAHLLTDGEGTPMQVVHRDVSPHNVLLSYSGDVKLIDFGVAKAKTNLTLTRSGIIKGKLQYMSPEQAQAQPVDARADIFSLGMTLYKMLTGRLPFGGHNEFQVYEQILRKRAAPPSHVVEGIPEIVDALVLRSLRKNPDERFPTALSMARLIDRALSELAPATGGNDLARFLAESLQRENRIPMTAEGDDFASASHVDEARPEDDTEDERVDRLTRADVPEPSSRPGLYPHGDTTATVVHRPSASTLAPSFSSQAPPISIPDDADFEGGESTALLDDDSNATQELADRPTQMMVVSVVPDEPPDAAAERPDEPVRARSTTPYFLFGLVFVGGFAFFLMLRDPDRRPEVKPSPPPRSVGAVAQPLGPTSIPRLKPPSLGSTASDSIGLLAREPRALAPLELPVPKPAVEPSVPSVPPNPPIPQRAVLTVSTLPWAWVTIDGQRLSRHTPLMGHALRSGRHKVTLETADGRRFETAISLKPGQRFTLSHQFK